MNSIGLTLIQTRRAPHHVEERALVFPTVKKRLNILNLRRNQREDYSSDEEYVILSRRILPIKMKIILLSISTLDKKGCICRTHIFNTNTNFYVIYGVLRLD